MRRILILAIGVFLSVGSLLGTQRENEKFIVVEFPHVRKAIFIRGTTDPSLVKASAKGIQLHRNGRKLKVKGVGELQYLHHTISLKSDRILFDGVELPANVRNFVLGEDGNLSQGFIRTFDREPLRSK